MLAVLVVNLVDWCSYHLQGKLPYYMCNRTATAK